MHTSRCIRAPLAGCLIILSLLACDNVSWGGADIAIVPPPPRPHGVPAPGTEPGEQQLPRGPLLYHVMVAGQTGTLIPIGEIAGDSMLPLRPQSNSPRYFESFMAEHLRPGSEFVLFRQGVRAGTLIVQSASIEAAGCRPGPRAVGSLELGPAGAGATEFLALDKLHAPQVARRSDQNFEPTRTMRVLAPIFADRMLRARGAPLPGNWDRALARLVPFPVANVQDAAFAATFLVGDTLGPGLNDDGHALFFIASPAQLGYDTVFVGFRDYAAGGKAAPGVIDFLDWNADDSVELLLRVYGVQETWLEAVGRDRHGRWQWIFEDRCERPASPPDTSAALDTLSLNSDRPDD